MAENFAPFSVRSVRSVLSVAESPQAESPPLRRLV